MNEGAQEQVLEEMALTNANEQCKTAILSLPMEPAPTLDDMLHAAATEERPTQKLNWKTDSLVWVEQWPLSKEKLKALQELVDEQLAKGHIVETTSPWNSPVFVIKKANKGKWRLLHDLHQINNVIEDMGSLQPGMPSPAMLPQNWNLAIIDIKDCFFQIPLHPDDDPRFTFSVPTLNRKAPRKRYHWKFLPQGMKNSLSICQWYLSSLLSPVHAAVGEAIILHYMDDVLVCAPNDDLLSHVLDLTINSLVAAGFDLQEEKILRMPPWKYLGLETGKQTTVPQKLVVKNNIKTIADVQQLCGSLNWKDENGNDPSIGIGGIALKKKEEKQKDTNEICKKAIGKELKELDKLYEQEKQQYSDWDSPISAIWIAAKGQDVRILGSKVLSPGI
ncbi:hypothetical protein DUI87_24313 [Hirundo rustica rustica]|uniref:ribonuclease H n=1 Tax=Hirundo rustica rustica TaxID=333673 RepID=A0A3M0JJB2_HIRRU|nr:hypothetical protein DUI87_24313 [Hirundo rustica rustica]